MFDNFQGMLALPEDPNKNAAARQGLLAFGASLLGGRGNLGGILGDGLMAGTQGYQGALAQQQQDQLRQAQMQQTRLENQKLTAGMARPGQIADSIKRARQGGAALATGASSAATIRPLEDLPRIGETVGVPSSQIAPPQQSAQPADDPFAYHYANAKQLAADGFSDEAKQEYEMAKSFRPEVREVVEMQLGGKRVMVQLFKDGRPPQVLDGYSPKAEKLNFQNTGGNTMGLDPFTGKPVNTIRNTQSPESAASVAATMRGQNMSDSRARELNEITKQGQRSQIINDPTQGPIVVDKGTGQARQVMLGGQPMPGEAAAKREASAKNLIPLIKQADKLIDGATGSYLGAGADQTARFFGTSTGGAQNIAQLRVLEGNIMMAQPRMEGPQSNMDVELYRQMAAQVGDPTVPNTTKKAALRTLKSLYAKYDPEAPAPAEGGKPQVKGLKDLPKKKSAGLPEGWSVKEK